MKKIFTLFFAVALLSTAAFAQKRHSDNTKNGYSYTIPYNQEGKKKDFDKKFDHDRKRGYDRDAKYHKDRDSWKKDHRFYVRDDKVKIRKRFSLQLIIGRIGRF